MTARMRATLALILSIASLDVSTLASAVTRETRPDEDWCETAQTLHPGDELVFEAGEYAGPCSLTQGGTAEAPVVLRAKDAQRRPRIVYGGRESDAVDILDVPLITRVEVEPQHQKDS